MMTRAFHLTSLYNATTNLHINICLISNTTKHHLGAMMTLVLYLWCYSYIIHRCTCPLELTIQPPENG